MDVRGAANGGGFIVLHKNRVERIQQHAWISNQVVHGIAPDARAVGGFCFVRRALEDGYGIADIRPQQTVRDVNRIGVVG